MNNKEDFISFIEKTKAEEYKIFSETDKGKNESLLIARLSEHIGFQRACDTLIQELKETE